MWERKSGNEKVLEDGSVGGGRIMRVWREIKYKGTWFLYTELIHFIEIYENALSETNVKRKQFIQKTSISGNIDNAEKMSFAEAIN